MVTHPIPRHAEADYSAHCSCEDCVFNRDRRAVRLTTAYVKLHAFLKAMDLSKPRLLSQVVVAMDRIANELGLTRQQRIRL